MRAPDRINAEDFPDSIYASELRAGVARLQFSPALEVIYRQSHLQRMQLRVRLWFSFAALMAIGDLVARSLGFRGHNPVAWARVIADLCDLTLAAMSWSRVYLRWYMPVARVLLPILGASYGIFVAEDIVVGQAQQLAALTLIVIVFLSFAGMLFRVVLVSMLCVVASFALSLALLGPFNTVEVRSLIMLLITVVLCVIGSRDIEQGDRRNFLERALIGELVVSDELTGLTNRRAFYDHLARLWQQAQRDRCHIAVLMADIDHFKKFNDSHGHQAGDVALRVTGRLLKGFARRPLDVAARYGGDEFVAVLYDLDEAAAQVIAERLRRAVLESPPVWTTNGNAPSESAEQSDLQRARPQGGPVTVSIGVGVVMPTPRRSPEGAVQLADEALYAAKQSGRNRVVVHGAEHYRRLDTGSFRKSNATP